MKIADLFCGAGGTSTGILEACSDLGRSVDLLAVNHWPTAVNTHTLNHPGVRHLCESLETINPVKAVGGNRLNLLSASPECTHHSLAAGGRPKNEQSRATAWHVCRWASDLTIENILIENVREFQNWGPLGANGKPLKKRKGETFNAFLNALRSMGFNVEHRVINAADYGDPTSRRRLIILARRGKAVVWPTISHGIAAMISPELKPYRTAREIIDWSLKGKSIFRRARPLSTNTMRRIAAGLRKFGGVNAEPFLVMLYGTNDGRSVDRPAPTVTANGGHIGLAQPFIVPTNFGERPGQSPRCHDVDSPMPTVVGSMTHGVCTPFITHITHHGPRNQHSVDSPVPTITTAHRGELALVEPILLGQQSGHNGSPMSAPVPTVSCAGAIALVQPFIVKYYGNEKCPESCDKPLATVTTKDRFMLVEPGTGREVAELDILFRMLQPHELAAAMSFPLHYKFTGNRGDQVKQIGNAVPVQLARACAHALLRN